MLLLTESTLFFLNLRKSSKKFTLSGEVKSWAADVAKAAWAFQADIGDLNGPSAPAGEAASSNYGPPQSLNTDSTLIGSLHTATSTSVDQDAVNDASDILAFTNIAEDVAEKLATVSRVGTNTVQVSQLSFNHVACFESYHCRSLLPIQRVMMR